MMHAMLTIRSSGANPLLMTKMLLPLAALAGITLGGCVQVQAPDKPIEINLNVNIKQEVVLSLKKDAADLITTNPELFPK
jgi:hypothetical protein